MSCNTTLYTDNYHGRDTNDMFFVLHSEDSISLQIMIHHFEMIGGLELTLMKGKLGEKTLFTIQQNDDIRLELSSGTYYLICEGVATNGRFGLSIEGKCYKESGTTRARGTGTNGELFSHNKFELYSDNYANGI